MSLLAVRRWYAWLSSTCVYLGYLPSEGVPRRLLLCFSVPANAKTILSTKKLPQVIPKLFKVVAVKLLITHAGKRVREKVGKPGRLCRSRCSLVEDVELYGSKRRNCGKLHTTKMGTVGNKHQTRTEIKCQLSVALCWGCIIAILPFK